MNGDEDCGEPRDRLEAGRTPPRAEKRKGSGMAKRAVFQKAFPYGEDVLALPVTDLEAAANWYAQHFAMVEVERVSEPQPTVIMERDGVRIGFSVNGGD